MSNIRGAAELHVSEVSSLAVLINCGELVFASALVHASGHAISIISLAALAFVALIAER